MAGPPATAGHKGFDLTQKLGPLPLWAWLGAAVGIWWYLQRQQAAKTSASGQQTDPAGNTGSIDPASGYVYGSPEDQAALAAASAGSSSAGTSAGTNATTGAQTYADNNSWGIAAVNYLVALGVDATTANAAVSNYLASQALTTAEQADVNLAIQKLGAPPSLPSPATSSPVTTTGTTSGPAVIMSLPDGSGGFEQVSFPNQAAVDAWTAWNQGFVNNNNAQASRSQWNAELTSLGVKRTDGQPLTPPSTVTGNPYDAR